MHDLAPVRVWCRVADSRVQREASIACDALVRAGFKLESPIAPVPGGLGLVFLSKATASDEEWIRRASEGGRYRTLVVISSGHEVTCDVLWRLLAAGAADAITWRGEGPSVPEIQARLARWQEVDDLLRRPIVERNLVGESARWRLILRQLVETSAFSRASVLLLGETGTGKELAARLIHTLDTKASRGELVVVDCANIAPGLAGSEFFGHERGAFTGAVAPRDGAFALAQGGTLFLDEVGDLPLELQAQLLRVVQERRFKRVGGNQWSDTHFRLVCATHHDLEERVSVGAFRADLFYRIATVTYRLPPLRERREDILPLARHFLAVDSDGLGASGIEPAVCDWLSRRDYPGNARDLRQLIGRMLSRHVGPGPLTVGDVPPGERAVSDIGYGEPPDRLFEIPVQAALARGHSLRDIGRIATETAINLILAESGGSIRRAARRLRVSERALHLRKAARRGAATPRSRGEGDGCGVSNPDEPKSGEDESVMSP